MFLHKQAIFYKKQINCLQVNSIDQRAKFYFNPKVASCVVLNLNRNNEENIEKGQCIFGYICQSITEWNRIYSFPALFAIATKLVTMSCSLFAFIQGLIIPSDYLSMMRWLMLSTALVDALILIIIFTAADMPVNEVKKYMTIYISLLILIRPSHKQIIGDFY